MLIKCNVTEHLLAKQVLSFASGLMLISRWKKKKTKLFLPTGVLAGALALSKIAATGGSDCAACLVSPFQRKSEREELLRKAEPRAVHTTVFHNKVAGKKQLFNTWA